MCAFFPWRSQQGTSAVSEIMEYIQRGLTIIYKSTSSWLTYTAVIMKLDTLHI